MKYLLYIWLPFLLISCQTENSNNGIPDVDVDFTFNIYQNDFSLAVDGGWAYFDNEGYNGIFVYRLTDEIFYAYDRACPHDYYNGNYVNYDDAKLELKDETCGATFDLINYGASKNQAVTKKALTQYKVRIQGDGVYRVSNSYK